jgi:GNAT superfamily N-acetyltransferase
METTRGTASRLRMVPAGDGDLAVVVDLLTEAAQWSRDRGIEALWRVPYPIEWVLPSLDRHEVFLARWNGSPVGTLTYRWDDSPFWGERPPDAGYVHKLAVRRSMKGLGLGARMLDWAGDRASRAGRPWLRLDCLTRHVALRSYYESLGFRTAGEAEVGGDHVTLLERPAARRSRPRAPGRRRPSTGQY